MDYASIVKKTQDSVVSITTESVSTSNGWSQYVTRGAGSGVIIQENGYILTCSHVVEDARKITVTLNDQSTYSATLIGMDTDQEIAVIKINASGLTAATYGDSSALQVGDRVVAIGNPLGSLGGTATQGMISSLNRNLTVEGKVMNLLQTDAAINPGNSGGGLFDSSGNLIGIVVAKSTGSDVEGLGFAIPVNTAAEIAKNLISNGSSSNNSDLNVDNYPKIGVVITERSSSASDGAGVYVISISGTNARLAGFEEGDKLIKVNGTKISNKDQLKSTLQKCKSGQSIEVVVLRNGKELTLKTTLE